MKFVDEVVITVQGGDGGDGCVAFRREAHVPLGGPSGGDGGKGGDVILVADPGLSTLLDQRYQRLYRAERAEHGQGHDRYGHGGASVEVKLPCGTMVLDADSGELVVDMVEPGQRFVAARGGRGGRGNIHFTTSTNQAPRRADPGQPGEQRRLRLELKLLADVGLVGLPNAGKSTLISHISAARPKIADYPFTTLIPCLGLVRLGERSFVVADIPGLIEGAHQGAGMGTQFLRHVERTRVLLYMLDDRHHLYEEPGSALADLELLRAEVTAHNPALATRPSLVALNKCDLLSPERSAEIAAELEGAGLRWLPISAVTGAGLNPLLEALWAILAETPRQPAAGDSEVI
jgi:GTPase